MSEYPSQPVTRIRQELEPSLAIRRVVEALLQEQPKGSAQEKDKPRQGVRFFTTAQRIVPLEDYRAGRFTESLRAAEIRMRKNSLHVIHLAETVSALESKTHIRLVFDPVEEDQPYLDRIVYAMNELEYNGDQYPPQVYIDLAKDSLKRNLEQRRRGAKELTEKLRDPTANRSMYVGKPRLVTKDFYPLPTPREDTLILQE